MTSFLKRIQILSQFDNSEKPWYFYSKRYCHLELHKFCKAHCLDTISTTIEIKQLIILCWSYIYNSRLSNENNENLEESQENQKKIGSAEKDPQTTGPSENLREEALEETDTENTDKEPA